jgi:solute carrier family 35, member F5
LRQVTSLQALLRGLDSPESREGSLPNAVITEADEAIDGESVGSDFSRRKLLYSQSATAEKPKKLGLASTAKLSFHFCMIWFVANYFAMGCLQYTTVGSTTILTSTSGVWTLLFGAIMGVEKFSSRKCLGVIASLIGIILISRIDTSADSRTLLDSGDDGGSSFPHKTPTEIALGDAMAAFSAMLYGVYTIVMKKQVVDESQVNMQLFFGLIGLFNMFLLWPGFIILHLTGIEPFALPDSDRVWTIILVRISDSLSWFP